MWSRDSSSLVQSLETKLTVLDKQTLVSFSPESVAEQLLAHRSGGSYNKLPEIALRTETELLQKWGATACELFNRLVVLHVLRLNASTYETNFPESVQKIYRRENDRIIDWIKDTEKTGFRLGNDLFIKDLKCLTTEMIPCGAQVVETASRLPIATLFSNGLRQGWEATKLLLSTKGHEPFFEIHTHTPTLHEFNEQGWDECYLRIAQLYRLFPDVKGMVGGSWFYDPAIKDISPRLAYLSALPISRGACLFKIGVTDGALRDALATSETRRRLHSQGKYLPTSYLLVWPRAQMIAWAESAAA